MDHVLIIGGSGILRDVCRHLADRGNVVSVVARNKLPIVEMVAETQKSQGLINPVAADYTVIPILQDKLIEAVAHLGPPVMTIAWINPDAFLARQSVAGFVNDHAPGTPLFDIWCGLGSSPPEPGLLSVQNFKILYRKIILGQVIEADKPRKLNREEITEGILKAIVEDKERYTIGRI